MTRRAISLDWRSRAGTCARPTGPSPAELSRCERAARHRRSCAWPVDHERPGRAEGELLMGGRRIEIARPDEWRIVLLLCASVLCAFVDGAGGRGRRAGAGAARSRGDRAVPKRRPSAPRSPPWSVASRPLRRSPGPWGSPSSVTVGARGSSKLVWTPSTGKWPAASFCADWRAPASIPCAGRRSARESATTRSGSDRGIRRDHVRHRQAAAGGRVPARLDPGRGCGGKRRGGAHEGAVRAGAPVLPGGAGLSGRRIDEPSLSRACGRTASGRSDPAGGPRARAVASRAYRALRSRSTRRRCVR